MNSHVVYYSIIALGLLSTLRNKTILQFFKTPKRAH